MTRSRNDRKNWSYLAGNGKRSDSYGVTAATGAECCARPARPVARHGNDQRRATMTSRVPMASLERPSKFGEAMGMSAWIRDHGLTGPKRRHVALGKAGASE